MKKSTYYAVFVPGADGVSVGFPDLPGCASWGKDAAEAERMATEALSLHLGGMERDGDAIPPPTDPPFEDVEPRMYVVPITIYPELSRYVHETRSVRANISMPAWMKRALDEVGANTSQIAQEAYLEYLGDKGVRPPL